MSKRKIYNSRWSDDEINALIEARNAMSDEFTKKTSQYHIIWKMIQSSRSELMNRQPQECSKKWHNLMDTFKKLKDPKTGTAPTKLNASNWIFFEKINDVMGSKQNIAPTDIIDSINYNASDNLIEYVPLNQELDDIDQLDQSSSSANEQPSTSRSISRPPKKRQSIADYIKERDHKIMRSLEKNNKIIKKVVQKYFPEVDLSSSESD